MFLGSQDYIQYMPFVAIGAFLLVRMLDTLFHEMGHAVAGYLITRQPVVVYIGSHGDKKNCLKIPLGKSVILLSKKVSRWNVGLTVLSTDIETARMKFFYVIAGPFSSLILAGLLFSAISVRSWQGPLTPVFAMCCAWCVFSFIFNIIPKRIAVAIRSRRMIYNDGYQLAAIIEKLRFPPEFFVLETHFANGQYTEALAITNQLIRGGTKFPDVYRYAISIQKQLNDFEAAFALINEQQIRIGKFNSHDRVEYGYLLSYLGKYEDAVQFYEELKPIDRYYEINLNNLGYILTLMGRYDDAIEKINMAINADNSMSYSYSNRAYTRFRMGFDDDSKKDNEYALLLDPYNSYIYRNEGLYEMKKGNYQAALLHFNKALELDSKTHLVDKYIEELKGVYDVFK